MKQYHIEDWNSFCLWFVFVFVFIYFFFKDWSGLAFWICGRNGWTGLGRAGLGLAKKNPFNNWAESGLQVQARGSGLSFKKNPARARPVAIPNIFKARISCKHSYKKCCIQGKVSVNESDKCPKSCWKPFFIIFNLFFFPLVKIGRQQTNFSDKCNLAILKLNT